MPITDTVMARLSKHRVIIQAATVQTMAVGAMAIGTVTDRNTVTTNIATTVIDSLNIMISAGIVDGTVIHPMPTHIIVGTKENILDTDTIIEIKVLGTGNFYR